MSLDKYLGQIWKRFNYLVVKIVLLLNTKNYICYISIFTDCQFCCIIVSVVLNTMETWLDDIKRVKIPRPKFGGKYPTEPPKDYMEECGGEYVPKQRHHDDKDLSKATEEIRRSLQEKL